MVKGNLAAKQRATTDCAEAGFNFFELSNVEALNSQPNKNKTTILTATIATMATTTATMDWRREYWSWE